MELDNKPIKIQKAIKQGETYYFAKKGVSVVRGETEDEVREKLKGVPLRKTVEEHYVKPEEDNNEPEEEQEETSLDPPESNTKKRKK